MKTTLAYVWKRRRPFFYSSLLVIVASLLSHPYFRQTIFGPTIDGLPWCVWEDDFRRQANPRRPRSWLFSNLEKLGLLQPERELGMHLDPRSALPLYLHLADDADVEVRLLALMRLYEWQPKDDATILPIMRRHLHDDDARCRMNAAWYVWQSAKDENLKDIVRPLLNHAESAVRRSAAYLLSDMAADAPELFETFEKLSVDGDVNLRDAATRAMRHFGKRGVPIIRRGLVDSDPMIRLSAIYAASELRTEGAELYPDLIVMQKDPDRSIRRNASHVLYIMDPKQFPKPATWGD